MSSVDDSASRGLEGFRNDRAVVTEEKMRAIAVADRKRMIVCDCESWGKRRERG